jgi:hypothetical protein
VRHPAELDSRKSSEPLIEDAFDEADGRDVRVLGQGPGEANASQEVQQVREREIGHLGQEERPRIALRRDEAGLGRGREQLARELDAGRRGPPLGELVLHPPEHDVPIHLRIPEGSALYKEAPGEAPVQRIGELEVPVADHLPRRGVHRTPPPEHPERLREGVVAVQEVREEEADAFEALAPEPALLEREEGTLGDGHRGVDVLPVRARLLDPQGESENARVDLRRLGGALGRRAREVCRVRHRLHPSVTPPAYRTAADTARRAG